MICCRNRPEAKTHRPAGGDENAGARFYPIATHAIGPDRHHDQLPLGYGNLSPAEITAGLAILGEHLENYRKLP